MKDYKKMDSVHTEEILATRRVKNKALTIGKTPSQFTTCALTQVFT